MLILCAKSSTKAVLNLLTCVPAVFVKPVFTNYEAETNHF